jgi:hypothetical protein
VEIVTADGERLHASTTEHPDLFWAIRGGGGNFGIVTAFHFRLHPIPARLPVCAVVYPWDQAREAMLHYDAFARAAPDDVAADAALVTQPSGERCLSISACHVGPDGTEEARQAALRPLVEFGNPVDAQLDFIPYLQMQSASDALFARGRRYYWKAQFLRQIRAEAVDASSLPMPQRPRQAAWWCSSRSAAPSPAYPTRPPHMETGRRTSTASRWPSGMTRPTTTNTGNGRAACGKRSSRTRRAGCTPTTSATKAPNAPRRVWRQPFAAGCREAPIRS